MKMSHRSVHSPRKNRGRWIDVILLFLIAVVAFVILAYNGFIGPSEVQPYPY